MPARSSILSIVVIAALGCSESSSPTSPPPFEMCGPFGEWQSSEYILPYPAGTSYLVGQANCSGGGHSGFWRYGYDFLMEIGTTVVASRSGVVVQVDEDGEDYDQTRTNQVVIRHPDGTAMLYSHLTKDGALVAVGDAVSPGDPIGLSGVTGNTGGTPHLHQSLHPCAAISEDRNSCRSMPFNFSNTETNPNGLQAGRSYTAN